MAASADMWELAGTGGTPGHTVKVPVRSNFRKFIFVDFSKVYVAVTYPAKPFFDPSTGSPFFPTVFLVILRPPLIGHVPTAQQEAWA